MSTLNTLNGSKVRLFLTPRRATFGANGLALAAAEQIGLRKAAVNDSQITGYIGNGRVAVLRPLTKKHTGLVSALRRGKGPKRANVTYRVKVLPA